MDGLEAARLIRAKSRKAITLPGSGAEMIIRKLQPYDFIGGEGMQDKILKRLEIPTRAMTPAPGEAPPVERDLAFESAYLKHVVSKASVKPRVIIDPAMEPAEDEVSFEDLADDAEFIFREAIEFAGLTRKAEVVEKFRQAEGQEPTGDR